MIEEMLLRHLEIEAADEEGFQLDIEEERRAGHQPNDKNGALSTQRTHHHKIYNVSTGSTETH